MGRIVIEVPWDVDRREAVDAVSSLALKEPHKRYGEWMRRLAEVVKRTVNPPKGEWQKWWTVSTKAFEALYRGWSIEDATNVALQYARRLGLNADAVRRLVKAIADNMDYIMGVHSREEVSGGGGARR